MSAGGILAVDLGGTKSTVGFVIDHTVAWSTTRATPARDGAAAVLAALASALELALARAAAEGTRVRAVGIGCAGVVDRDSGIITNATDAILGWAGADILATAASATGLPAVVLNDVHAHAMGEVIAGAGRGLAHVLVVTIGTGIGGAQVVEGEVVAGANGAAGHIGHVPVAEAAGVLCPCGRTGHVEGVAAGAMLPVRFREAGGPEGVDTAALFALADTADNEHAALARAVIDRASAATGAAIGGAVNVLDPSCIILGGGMAVPESRWWRGTAAAIAGQLVLPADRYPIVPAQLGAAAALVGAAHAAERLVAGGAV